MAKQAKGFADSKEIAVLSINLLREAIYKFDMDIVKDRL
nr:hypothetical protein [Mucilaginibacter sp. FT3.2]